MSKEVKSKEPAIEAEPKEKATKEPVNQKTAEAKKIYVGATVPGMKQNTVFVGDIPDILNVPFVRELCMEISQYGKFINDLKDKSSRAAFCYNKSVELAESLKK